MSTAASAPCLVFDLDGTLSDPSVGIRESINYALAAGGHPLIGAEAIAACIGPPLDDVFAHLVADADAAQIAGLVSKYREHYGAKGYAQNVLYAGVTEAIAHLRAAGCRLGVCTSKHPTFANQVLQLFELSRAFEFVSGGGSGVTKTMQLKALLDNGTLGADAVMIGDRSVDVSAAKANGLRSVGVLWGHGSFDELQAAQPDLLLTQPDQLRALDRFVLA